MNLENQENNTFLSNRGSGNYQIAWGSWFMDYLDPIDILTLCLTRSNNDSCQEGKGSRADVAAYSLDLTDEGIDVAVKDGTWAETYDVLIDAIRGEADDERRSALMHKAEDFVMASGINMSALLWKAALPAQEGRRGLLDIAPWHRVLCGLYLQGRALVAERLFGRGA